MPFALCAMGAWSLVFLGCEKKSEPTKEAAEEKAVEPYAPESYMNDPAFRKGLKDRNAALKKIVSARAPLVKRMEELAKAKGGNREELEKLSEWNELYKQVESLNKQYEQGRKDLLKYASARITPPSKKISK